MYAARAGMECFVFMPRDTPVVNQYEASLFGAKAYLIDGLINDCGKVVREGASAMNWFDLSTLKEPYRIEGKKTMGLELAEQFNWQLPDVILYPTGGGTGLIGMWKAFEELAHETTPMGEISLRRRLEPTLKVDVYEVKLDDEFLMSSLFTTGETALAELARQPAPWR